MQLRKIAAAVLTAAALLGGTAVAAAPAAHASTVTCKTIYEHRPYTLNLLYAPTLSYGLWVPVCWNGSHVWLNGGITPLTFYAGWNLDITWYGSYHDASQAWLGVGENIDVSLLLRDVPVGFTIAPRWYIGANGQTYATSDVW
jgi:hypothetical protein